MATHVIRLGLILSLSILWFLGNTGQSLACSCGYSPLSEALADSSSVSAGRAIARSEFETSSGWSAFIVEFEVITVWKGPLYETMYLATNKSEDGCGFRFRLGVEYIVYSYNGWTGLCTRTAIIEMVREDLAELGEGRSPQPGTKGPIPGTPEFPPQQSPEIEWVDPASGGCSLSTRPGSATTDAAWLGIMAGLVWFGVRRRPRP